MNVNRIYSEAVGRVPTNPEEPPTEDSAETAQERELRFLNWNMQQTTREIAQIISTRIDFLDNQTALLAQSEGKEYSINRNLLERHTLNKTLVLLKKGNYNVD